MVESEAHSLSPVCDPELRAAAEMGPLRPPQPGEMQAGTAGSGRRWK